MLVLVIISFSSCSEFLKGKPKNQDYIEIKSSGALDCLKDVSTDLTHFLNSEADPSVLDKTMACIDSTLTEFQTKVEGRENASSFTADEVYEIFKTFVSSANLTREAAVNIIKLKAALLGGDSSRITKLEINDLKRYLHVVKEEAKKLAPYIKVFYMKETDKQFTPDFIKESFAKLALSLKRLLAESKLANSNYTFTDFKNLLINVLNLSNENQKMVEVLTKVNYVLNGYQTELNEIECEMYIDSLCEFLRLYAMHKNSYVKLDFQDIYELDDTVGFLKEIIDLLQNSLQYKKTYLISVNSLDHLMYSVATCGLFKYNIRASSLINFYKTIVVRMFESGIAANIQNFTGLKPVNFLNFKREVAIYQIYSRLLKRTFPTPNFQISNTVSYNIRELQRIMASLSISEDQDILSQFDGNNQYLILSAVKELRDEFISASPVLYLNNKIGLANDESHWMQNISDLTRGIYVKMLSRFMMIGYGTNNQVINMKDNSISEVSMYLWYGEFKALGIELKGFDPRMFNGGTSFLKVANLFTRGGNGDSTLSFNELNENMGVMLSGGAPLFDKVYADLKNARCELPELDVYGLNWNVESCFMQVLKQNYRTYFVHLPHLLTYLENLSDAQFTSYMYELLNIARYSQNTAGQRVEKSDIVTLHSMLYYIESVYVLHDTDRNTLINEAEIRAAYPKFQKVATDFAETTSKAKLDQFTSWQGDAAGFGCFSRADLIRESFIFLAFNGRTPELGDFNSFPCFTGKPLVNFQGEISRHQIVNVFKSLKNVLAPN